MLCKECGHTGMMHSDGEFHHKGECVWEFENGNFCNCKEFEKTPTEEGA